VLTAAIPSIETSLTSIAAIQDGLGDPGYLLFQRTMTPLVQPGEPYVSVSLWSVEGSAPEAKVGDDPKLMRQAPEFVGGLFNRVQANDGMVVVSLLDGDDPRLGYAVSTSISSLPYVLYAEAALPPNRTSVVRNDSAFSGLANAVYLGTSESSDSLLLASTDDLPLTGRRATETIEFGDTKLLLVMSPTEELGSELLANLALLVGVVGLVAAVAGTVLVERLLRRRTLAEALATENARLYAHQRTISHDLQHSLLPDRLPHVQGVEVAARYVPGTEGLDIGGDWYDAIDLGDGRLMMVVGDVSGRGLRAASIMASLRFSTRAFVSEGREPEVILNALSRLIDVGRDEHFATVLCASLHTGNGQVSMAKAGHPNPLIVDRSGAAFLEVVTGPPLGIGYQAYESTTVTVPDGATLIAFTDGLFERRDEPIDEGLERLRLAASRPAQSLEHLLNVLIDTQIGPNAFDDAAVVGVRWTRSTS